jgi:pimeloyl-ACP methyl ester carboxylesterase
MKQLFLFSGLGADKRVFDFLDLPDYVLHYVVWPKPIGKESLAEYAKRLLPQITKEKPVLIGVSFGGMIALEIAKLIPVEKVIQISSAKSSKAIPLYFRIMAKLNLQKLMSPRTLKTPNELLFWLFGVTTQEHKALLTAIMKDTDETFFTWAIETISFWENKTVVDHIVQIHGSKDRILNSQTADFIIEGGGHFMVVTRAEEVSYIVSNVLR